jgi:hypothetical protein
MKNLVFKIALTIFTFSFSISVMADTVDASCAVDTPCAANEDPCECTMRKALQRNACFVNADKAAKSVELEQAPDIKRDSCFSTWEKIGADGVGSLPSWNFNLSGLLDRLKRAACKVADDAVKKTADNMRIRWQAPYGLGGVNVGLNTKGTTGISTRDSGAAVTDPIEDLAIKTGDRYGREAVDTISNSTSGVTNVNRNLQHETDQKANTSWLDATKKLWK